MCGSPFDIAQSLTQGGVTLPGFEGRGVALQNSSFECPDTFPVDRSVPPLTARMEDAPRLDTGNGSAVPSGHGSHASGLVQNQVSARSVVSTFAPSPRRGHPSNSKWTRSAFDWIQKT